LRKDLPSFGDATYGCKKVQANPNGAGCFLDNEWTTWTYTPPTSSSSSTTTGFVPSTTTGSGN
ncbi:MAG: hypothetical protein KDK51_10215, partial [Deltaproteobacteria bacterium]|nr:hypothetical protein [Deltaproteobacteria bacterium]